MVFAEELQKRPQGALPKDVISALWAVTSNIAQSPDSLLSDIQDRRRKELDELRDSPSVDDDLGVLRCARRDVSKRPCCLKLGAESAIAVCT